MNFLKKLQTAKELLKMKDKYGDDVSAVAEQAAQILDKVKELGQAVLADKNAISLSKMLGVDKHIISGNSKNVFNHYMKNAINSHIVIKTSVWERNDGVLSINGKTQRELEQTLIIDESKNHWGELICAAEFKVVEEQITKSFKAELNKIYYLGNKYFELKLNANLVEKGKEHYIHLKIELINTQTGEKMVNFFEEIQLKDVEFNLNGQAFAHANLPHCINNYVGINADNNIVLSFVLC